jgi:hypothetical protein
MNLDTSGYGIEFLVRQRGGFARLADVRGHGLGLAHDVLLNALEG